MPVAEGGPSFLPSARACQNRAGAGVDRGMNAPALDDATLGALLSAPWTVGDPDVVGSLAVFPLFGGPTGLTLVPFSAALSSGVKAKELPEGASVRDLLIENPTSSLVLLLDGEEVLGAQQNRVFDGSVIVPAASEVRVAVCCVERNRWDGRRRHEAFRASSQVSHPQLRRTMERSRSEERRASQRDVWDHVATMLEETGTASGTSAMADVYGGLADRLDRARESVCLHPGQRGVVAFVGGRFAALDWIACPDAFAELHPRIVRGYALDAALAAAGDAPPTARDAESVVEELAAIRLERGSPAGDAQRIFGGSPRATVSGLVRGGRAVQVSALSI